MHDHGEKFLYCKPCGYWKVTSRFGSCICPKCKTELHSYSSRNWLIENVDKKFEKIPKCVGFRYGLDGFVDDRLEKLNRILKET